MISMIPAARREHDDHKNQRLSASKSAPRFFDGTHRMTGLIILFIRPKTESGRLCVHECRQLLFVHNSPACRARLAVAGPPDSRVASGKPCLAGSQGFPEAAALCGAPPLAGDLRPRLLRGLQHGFFYGAERRKTGNPINSRAYGAAVPRCSWVGRMLENEFRTQY